MGTTKKLKKIKNKIGYNSVNITDTEHKFGLLGESSPTHTLIF